MEEKKRVVIDAGHGGDTDPGAVYDGRKEKDDTLRLALAVGQILEDEGVDVVYTRVSDIYDSPYEKAQMGNRAEADYFISLHRNATDNPVKPSGILSLVYEDKGIPARLARSINRELEKTGFADLGVSERPGLVVLRRTQMPSVLVETGFIDNPADNRFFDEHFDEIAKAIADGILEELETATEESMYYMIQTGAYRIRSLAEQQAKQLQSEGYPAYLVAKDGWYYVRVGAFRELDNAVNLERELRRAGYNTLMIHEAASR